MTDTHRDPTLEAAQRSEIKAKGCAVCRRRKKSFWGYFTCTIGRRFPKCRSEGKFKLIVEPEEA